ncbi:MAG: patatin-like phospholipase family protein, partial [Candidatus Paceibacterota bacterium]
GNLQDMIVFGQNLWFNIIKGSSSIWVHKLFKYLILSAVPILLFFVAMNISFFLHGPMWLTVALSILWFASFILPYLVFTKVKSVYSSKPLQALVYKYFDPAKTKAAGKKLIVGAISWGKGTYESATEDNPNIRDWVLASSAFPLFLDNIKIENLWYTDGGVRRVAPLQDAIDAGATEVDVVLASSLSIGPSDVMPPLTGQLMRTLDIYFYQIIRDNLIDVARLYPDVKIRVFMPDCSLTSDSLSFDPKSIRYMFEQGRRVALKPMTIQETNATIFGC